MKISALYDCKYKWKWKWKCKWKWKWKQTQLKIQGMLIKLRFIESCKLNYMIYSILERKSWNSWMSHEILERKSWNKKIY